MDFTDKKDFVTQEAMVPKNNSIWIVYKDNEGKCYMVCAEDVKDPRNSLNSAGLHMQSIFREHNL